MSSFGEAKALKFAKMDTLAILQYNQRQLSRIYPAGARIDSSNYNPVILWNVGCQLGDKQCLVAYRILSCFFGHLLIWVIEKNLLLQLI